jgi:hypothetical protein
MTKPARRSDPPPISAMYDHSVCRPECGGDHRGHFGLDQSLIDHRRYIQNI